MRKVLAVAAAGFVLAFGAVFTANSALANPGDALWKPCATSGVSDDRPNGTDCTSEQVVRGDDGVSLIFTGGTPANIEALSLPGWEVDNGDPITFEYNGECGGGSPRVYVTVGGTVYHTGDSAQSCGVDIGDGWKKVTYNVHAKGELKAAKVGGWDVAAAGVVVDNPLGLVRIRNVHIGSNAVNFKATEPLLVATPEKPDYTAPTCDTTGVVKVKITEGVEYATKRNVENGITVSATVTAKAKERYTLKEGAEATWTFPVAKLTGDACLKLVTPQKPATQEPTCTEPPMYQNEAEGVLYSHVGLPSGNDWYTVGAKPKPGYKFPADAVTQWRIDIKWPSNCEDPTQPPTPSPTTSNGGNGGGGNPAPTTSNAAAGGDLPVTGPGGGIGGLVTMGAIGLLLISGGGLLLVAARRRRDAGEVESA